MKTKTMNAVISKKVDDWLRSIKDDKLRRSLKDKVIVTGGCITSMLLNEEVNDFDIYLKDKETTKAVAEHYCKRFNKKNKNRKNKLNKTGEAWVLDGSDVKRWKNGEIELLDFTVGYKHNIEYDEEMEWNHPDRRINNSVSGMLLNTDDDRIKIIVNSDGIAEDSDSVADDAEYNVEEYVTTMDNVIESADEITTGQAEKAIKGKKYRPIFLSSNAITLSDKVQIVIRFHGEPEEIHTNYDFIHTTNYWTAKTGVVLNQRALEAIINKELFYSGSKYPIASMVRTRKFIKRGWQINAGQYLKMAWQISRLDLNDVYVLEDQCTGVDSLYFLQFIQRVQRMILENSGFELTDDYLTTVIDRIF